MEYSLSGLESQELQLYLTLGHPQKSCMVKTAVRIFKCSFSASLLELGI